MDRIGAWILAIVATIMVSIAATGLWTQRADDELPALLKIGILPDEAEEKLAERYEPLLGHLSEYLSLPCELVFFESYDALVNSFAAGSVDLAYFGGLTFVQSRVAYDAVPLVMRDVDTRFTSCFVARADSTATNIADCEDSVIAFGSKLSTSGHLMPRHFLQDQGIVPEAFFSEVRYSGAHDTTIEWVRDGEVAIGAVNSRILRAMMTDGRIEKGEFRILWETPPYSDYVWAVQSSLGKIGRQKLRDAFLVLSPDREEYAKILRSLDAGGFLPVEADSYSGLKEIASNMELL